MLPGYKHYLRDSDYKYKYIIINNIAIVCTTLLQCKSHIKWNKECMNFKRGPDLYSKMGMVLRGIPEIMELQSINCW